jgi:hypothetical protein
MVNGEGVSPQTAMGANPDPEHPAGTIGVLACADYHGDPGGSASYWCDLSVAEVDVATAKPIAQVHVGDHVENPVLGDGAHGAFLWFHDGGGQSWLLRFDGVRRIVARQPIPALDRDPKLSPCRYTAVGEEMVLSACGDERHRSVRSWTIDAGGRVVAKHDCPGGSFSPSFSAHAVRNRVVLTELQTSDTDWTTWACSFNPDAPAVTTRRFPFESSLFVSGDDAYVMDAIDRNFKNFIFHKVDDDLRPVGPPVDRPGPGPHGDRDCQIDRWGENHADRFIEGLAVVALHYCCGERGPSAVFICDPHADYL